MKPDLVKNRRRGDLLVRSTVAKWIFLLKKTFSARLSCPLQFFSNVMGQSELFKSKELRTTEKIIEIQEKICSSFNCTVFSMSSNRIVTAWREIVI